MTQASDFLENAIINTYFRGQATTPTSAWIGLFNGNPGDAGGGGTEVTTTVRPAGRLAAGFAAPAGGVGSNAGIVDFGTVNADVTITHFGLFDAASGGNLLAYGNLVDVSLNPVSRSLLSGDGLTFPVGALVLTVT